eukprot:gene14807-biopygen14216
MWEKCRNCVQKVPQGWLRGILVLKCGGRAGRWRWITPKGKSRSSVGAVRPRSGGRGWRSCARVAKRACGEAVRGHFGRWAAGRPGAQFRRWVPLRRRALGIRAMACNAPGGRGLPGPQTVSSPVVD